MDKRTVKISGGRLAALWKSTPLSRDKWALRHGVSPRWLSEMSQPGVHEVSPSMLERIAKEMGMTEEQLMEKIGPVDNTGDRSNSKKAAKKKPNGPTPFAR